MVYGFVKQSRGHIRIYSEVGVGTSIKLYFPRAAILSDAAQSQLQAEDAPQGHEHILLVEDDELVRQMVIVLLEGLGYKVTAVNCAKQALEQLSKDNSITLLFSDIVMPGGINGIELARQAKQLYPDLPILLTSGYSESAAINGHNLPHGTRLIGKPYRRYNLAVKLRDILDTR